jgi:enamine deaminase RidA (YjgF/YER057c/UK114 family)
MASRPGSRSPPAVGRAKSAAILERCKMTKRDAVFPANRHALYAAHGYSAAIRSGGFLFVSGQVGSRSDGTPEPDFGRQVQLAFDNLRATLAAGGCSFDDIVDVTTFHTDPENQFKTIMAVKRENISAGALSELDGCRRQMARRLRFRDQGHRPHSRQSLSPCRSGISWQTGSAARRHRRPRIPCLPAAACRHRARRPRRSAPYSRQKRWSRRG